MLDVRADVVGNRLRGHAAVFNQETRISEFYEEIDPRAFDRVLLSDPDTVMQVDHSGLPLGRTTSGTLRLAVDSTGLEFDCDLPNTTLARDARELVDRGDLRACSFGFQVAEDVWSLRKDGAQKRVITVVGRLFDVSVVTFPAYAGTDVALRSGLPTPPKISVPATARDQYTRIRQNLRKGPHR